MPELPTPRWMTLVLHAAAVYNLVWGVALFVFPTQLFTWAGMAAPNYPAFVQCLGVLIGAFGIGYSLAASDPASHWGLVLAGLLSKILAPIGFVGAVATGLLPPIFLLAVFVSDVAWWLPMTVILLHAIYVSEVRAASGTVGTLVSELQQTRLANGETLWDASFRQPLLIVFIRHLGCAFCREALDDLKVQGEQIASAGALPIVVHATNPDEVQPLLDHYRLKDVAVISDPTRRLYRAFELQLGTWRQILGARVLWRAIAGGVVLRHGFGAVRGSMWQLTGAFLVHRGEIVRCYRNKSSSDRPNYAVIACGTEEAEELQPLGFGGMVKNSGARGNREKRTGRSTS